jgi:hypothetical protein
VIGEPVWLEDGHSWRRTARCRSAVFGLALLLGSVALAGALGWVGSTLLPRGSTQVLITVGVITVAVILRETVGRRIPLPGTRWQVPRRWLRHNWTGAAAFGWIMGIGVLTRQPSALFHLYLVGCLVSGGAGRGMTFGLVFGAVYLTLFLHGAFVAARSEEGDGVFAGWAISVRRWLRLIGVLSAPLILLVPM